ncbi:hypothetical protein H6F89_10420 [Cyanobacteria bacterium FACHB-63]|nr:hypothetical protein [Cyanobacteria bacterium FACHB-63]
MKRSKILLLSLIGIAVAAVSGGYYFWRQFTQLPDWYAEEQTSPRTYTQIQESGAAIEKRIAAQIQTSPQSASTNIAPNSPEPQPSKPVQVALSSKELNDLLVTKITEKRGGKALPNSVKGFHTSVKNDQLKTGAVVDIKELQNSGLGAQHQALLTQITKKIPVDRRVYIGIEGKPEIQNGKLHFDENARIQVGNMSFTIAEVASRLGVPPQKVQDQLNLELKLRGLTVKDIDFQDGNAVLSGAAK